MNNLDPYYQIPQDEDSLIPNGITHGYGLSDEAVHLKQVHDADKVIKGESVSILRKISSLSLHTDEEELRKEQQTGCTIDEAYYEMLQPRTFVPVSLEEQKQYFFSLPLEQLLEKSRNLAQVVEIMDYFFSAWVPAISKAGKGKGVADYPFYVGLEHIRRGVGNMSRLSLNVCMFRLEKEEGAEDHLSEHYASTPSQLVEEIRTLIQQRVLYMPPFTLDAAYAFVTEVFEDTEDNNHHGLRLIENCIRSLSKRHADVIRLLDLEQEIFSALYLLHSLPEEERPKVSPTMEMVPYVLYDLLLTKVFRGKKHPYSLLSQCETMLEALKTNSELEEETARRTLFNSSSVPTTLSRHLRGLPMTKKSGKFLQESALSLLLQKEMTPDMIMPYHVTMHGVVGALCILGKSKDPDDRQTFREAISLKKGPQDHTFFGNRPLTYDREIPPKVMENILRTLPQDLVKLLKQQK